jgi:N-acyl-D-amino-acid deacylase
MTAPAAPTDDHNGRADIIIRHGTVVDGTGAPGQQADVAITGDRITAIGDLGAMAADEEVDATGLIVAPGFIDVHTHDDRYLFTHPDMAPKASQGVTTVVTGNCGFSLAPWKRFDEGQFPFSLWQDRPELCFETAGAFLDGLDEHPPAVNAAALIGHSSLRYGNMDDLQRPATDAEIAAMQQDLAEAIDGGAIGMSSGLFYPPAQAATTQEVTAVAEAMAPADGIYTAHIRDESVNVLASIEEAATIAREAGVQLVISHHKTAGVANFGRTVETLPLIDKLRHQQRLSLDVYPYIASSTMILPHMVDRAERVMVTWSKPYPDCQARDLDEIAGEWGVSRREAAEKLSPGGAVYFQLNEEDVQRVLRFDGAMIGSDGIPDDLHPHPRLWGTFARVLGHYSRDLKLFPLEEAVHRMSGLPAATFGFKDRGTLAPGAFADVVLFDAATVIDAATFERPAQPAIGIRSVFVNGGRVWQDGRPTGQHTGRPIRLKDTNRGQQAA